MPKDFKVPTNPLSFNSIIDITIDSAYNKVSTSNNFAIRNYSVRVDQLKRVK